MRKDKLIRLNSRMIFFIYFFYLFFLLLLAVLVELPVSSASLSVRVSKSMRSSPDRVGWVEAAPTAGSHSGKKLRWLHLQPLFPPAACPICFNSCCQTVPRTQCQYVGAGEWQLGHYRATQQLWLPELAIISWHEKPVSNVGIVQLRTISLFF